MKMAVFVKHVSITTRLLAHRHVIVCNYATKAEKKKGLDRKVPPKLEWTAQSLASKGFLRAQKDYEPPESVNSELDGILNESIKQFEDSTQLGDAKFQILNSCYEKFHHAVPNSILHSIECVGDLKDFYNTPVETKTPLDKLKTLELPANLHIQYDYHRFHPDTDTKFGGVTAFPRSSTLVTGLKYKEKYRGHKQENPWHVD